MIRISGEEYFWQFYLSYGQGKALKVRVIVSKWEMHLHSNCLCRNFNGFFHSGGLSFKLQMPRIISWLFTIGDNSPNLNELYHSPEKLIPRWGRLLLSWPVLMRLTYPPPVDPIKIQSWGLSRRERTKMLKISAANSRTGRRVGMLTSRSRGKGGISPRSAAAWEGRK